MIDDAERYQVAHRVRIFQQKGTPMCGQRTLQLVRVVIRVATGQVDFVDVVVELVVHSGIVLDGLAVADRDLITR